MKQFSYAGQCLGNVSRQEENVLTREACHTICRNVSECRWFTFYQDMLACNLLLDCPTLDESCSGCISGESRCKQNPKGLNYKINLDFTLTQIHRCTHPPHTSTPTIHIYTHAHAHKHPPTNRHTFGPV